MSADPDLAPLLHGLAPAVVRELTAVLRGCGPVRGWSEGPRRFVRVGDLFVSATSDPADKASFAAEVAMRRALPRTGPLQAPTVVADGPGWHVARAVDPVPLADVDPELVARAVGAIRELPVLGASRASVALSRRARAVQRGRLLSSRLPLRDLRAARRVAAEAAELVPSHNDLHLGNVLATPEALVVVDWEHCGPGPSGGDLARLIALDEPTHADAVLEAASALPGAVDPARMARLHYAAVVRSAADMLLAADDQGYDPDRAAGLIRVLPELRTAAGL